ncbi:MAG: Stk1 family PASTA domain-containing Ser/Thr kinase [Firmicutes bacterium]|nr:Stk1 family PASTA domain-containing Ser/Thr kinase [Bacillota bacterium]
MGSKILAGRYELLERKGDGGMAVVYKAKDRLLNRNVAIKILKPEFIRDPKFIDSFRRESQAAAGLSHQNIVSIYDVGKEGNIYYIVMELMDGAVLSDVIRKEAPMDEKRVAQIAKQIAAGLSSAHKKKIVHRDVKPHNILMDHEGTVKITDFGIAKAVNTGTIVNSKTSAVMGSVHYLSPEQAKGTFYDATSDIYSLGIVMYEMLTGNVPFDGENAVSVAMMHINSEVPAPSLENPTVSALMDAIVLKATRKIPGERFASADELITALENAENQIAMVADGATSVYGFANLMSDEKLQPKSEDVNVLSFEDLEAEFAEKEEPVVIEEDVAEPEPEVAPATPRKSKRMQIEAKKKKRSKILGIVLALICAIPLSLFLINNVSLFSAADISVPDLVNMTQEEAIAILEAKGLDYKLGTPVLSENIESGRVVSTDPEAGDEVRKGYRVTIILSRGDSADKVKTPNCVGKPKEDAKKLLEVYNLKMGSITEEVSELPEGTVISQTPEAGSEVAEGTEVSFVVSLGGGEKVAVPDLLGMTRKDAKAALEEVGLNIGTVTEEESIAEKGTVISQSVAAKEEVQSGTRVDLVLSTGVDTSATPQEIAMAIDYGAAKNEVFILTVTVTDNYGIHYIVNNQQRIKADASETVVLSGHGTGTVRVIFDNEIVMEKNANFTTGELS